MLVLISILAFSLQNRQDERPYFDPSNDSLYVWDRYNRGILKYATFAQTNLGILVSDRFHVKSLIVFFDVSANVSYSQKE